VPDTKDLYFFDRYYRRGLDWYAAHFRSAPEDVIAIGELSHDYLFSQAAAERIRMDLPGVRLMSILRDPVERTFSHYLFLVRSGLTRRGLLEAVETVPELIENSLYHKHLSHYYRLFQPDQIGIFDFDELAAEPALLAGKIFAFLGLPFVEEPDFDRRVLPASRTRSYPVARLAKVGAGLLRTLGGETWLARIKSGRLYGWLYPPYAPGKRPTMTPGEREILRGYFVEDIRSLEGLLGRDYSRWLE
jgi:hypothetical protein